MTRAHTSRCQLRTTANTWGRFVLVSPFVILAVSCGVLRPPTPTPLPGWRSPVSELFLDESAFPEGWQIGVVNNATTDPTINHVAREWEGNGVAFQSIWRAYTGLDAERKYDELRASQFHPSRTLPPYEVFVEFKPPDEIRFQSHVADEFYIACGWWTWAYCEVIARYRNYVVELRLDQEATYEGHVTHGLTYPEIEAVVRAMDARFSEVMETFYPIISVSYK